MSRVKLYLECQQCGSTFEHIKFCNNSSEAASYEEWAKENITMCPLCFKKSKHPYKRVVPYSLFKDCDTRSDFMRGEYDKENKTIELFCDKEQALALDIAALVPQDKRRGVWHIVDRADLPKLKYLAPEEMQEAWMEPVQEIIRKYRKENGYD